MNLIKICPGCGGFVHVRRLTCTCGHAFRRSKPNVCTKSASRKHEIRDSRAQESVTESGLRKISDRACKARKKALEAEPESQQRRTANRASQAKKRALETDLESEQRKTADRAYKARKKALETDPESEQRKTANRACQAHKRALETDLESEQRKTADRAYKARKKALETDPESEQRKTANRACKARKRALESQVETAKRRAVEVLYKAKTRALQRPVELCIDSFLAKTKQGPDYVCTICHRMMYKQTVVTLNKQKYTNKAEKSVLTTVFSPDLNYFSFDGNVWICKTCDGALSRGKIPVQAKANSLILSEIPPELSCLNPLEIRLLSLRVPFMKIVALPSGKQRCIHGPAVNVPSKLDSVCTVLPRLPSQTDLVPLKLKRKLAYKGHYMYDYITAEKVMNALKWLKLHNPLYADVDINEEWSQDAQSNDHDLYAGLVHSVVQSNTQPSHSITHPDEQPQETNLEISDSSLTTALHKLQTYARQNNLTIHDVPGNGNCLYNAVLYQLQSVTLSAAELRHMVASYLHSHSETYMNFISAPVLSQNGYNADSEAPNEEDICIASIQDPEICSQLTFQRYISRLRTGAWGDHIVIAALANMFNITINVVQATDQTCTVATTTPEHGEGAYVVNLGLLMQYHFVGLDQHNELQTLNTTQSTTNTEQTTPNASSDPQGTTDTEQATPNDPLGSGSNSDSPLDDATIDKGDEHIRNITGGPLASMMTLENPEANPDTVCVAPAEGQTPLSIMTDTNFELMCNPEKFPYGDGGFNSDRLGKLTYRKYFNQRLLDVDGRFARDIDYLFVAQYIVEAKQILDDANSFIWRQKPGGNFTANQARDQSVMSQCLRKDKAYRFMKNVRGSPPYYQRTLYELLAMMRQLGTPTFFLTLSAADLKWPDVIQTIARQYGVYYTEAQVSAMSFEDKSNWIRRNPVTAARHYQYRLNTFFQDFLKSSAKPLGEVSDYAIRIEFQARGSPHAHTVLWVSGAPKYGVDDVETICQFIDHYISCAIPDEEGLLKELVLHLQQHRHSSYCRRNKGCHFDFPHPPSPHTLIAKPSEQPSDAQKVLTKVRKALADQFTLDQVLEKADVTPEQYESALKVSKKGNVVVLKREPQECNINNYNPHVMLAWQANTDIQYILDPYSCIMYVASYMMKNEKAMGELLKRVANEARTEDLKQQMRKVGSAFLTHREVSAQEVAYRLLSLPMKTLSRSVVFVDTNPKNERVAVLKNKDALEHLDDDDTNVFQKSLIDRYQHRPSELQSMCLAEFAATYVTDYRQKDCDGDSGDNDVLPSSHDSSDSKPSHITLTDNFGKMYKRKKEAIIRFRRYNRDAEPSNWYRAKLMLYFPWYNENTDLLGGYSTYEEHYHHVLTTVNANEFKYTQSAVEDIQVDEDGPPEHVWSQIAPNTEHIRAQSEAEGTESLTEVSQEDLQTNANLLTNSTPGHLHVRFESAAKKQEIPPHEYRKLLQGLNAKQRQIVMFHRNWCKKTVIALKQNKPIEPYHVFVSGPGGVGKSHVIKLIHSDTIRFLKLSGTIEPDDVTVLLTAPTGVAAYLISGMTLHSALILGRGKYGTFQPLNHDRLNTLRSKLSHLVLLIIDEVSMVGSNMLLEIHKRLQQIKSVLPEVTFGGVSILAVGDLYQLPPVGQVPIFNPVSDSYARLYQSGSLWVDNFQMIELDEIMRQKGDSAFCELLCRVRIAECTDSDLAILKSRETTSLMPDYPNHALHVYRLNVDVDERNGIMLNALAPDSQQYSIQASDAIAGQTNHIDLSTLSDKRSDTGGLHGVLKLAIGARVMLTTNVDVADGLVNGARGEVVHVATSHTNKITHVLVKFNNPDVGTKAKQSSPFHNTYPDAVPLVKHEAIFLAKGKRGSEITRLQFPLTLAWATTIHKVQGLTLDEIVVDMKGGRFNPGQAYVAFSRVKKLDGLHILNFNPKAIKASADVKLEMQRLSTNLLTPIPVHICPPLSDNQVSIALLNARSIVSKVADIQCDDSLKSAAILCFTETWLTLTQPSPTLVANHTVLRSDRVSGENKGGVMICLHQSIQPVQVTTIAPRGILIEAITATLVLSNCSHSHLQVTLIYRSPSVPTTTLLNMLSDIMHQMAPPSIPAIVLGDFNEDLLTKPNSQLVNFMSSHHFSQLAQGPTTDSGTLIDHVYYKGPLQHLEVHISDTYYSDHDTIFCSLVL